MNKPYYLAYESRYQTVYAAGAERWGHSPDDETLRTTLEKFVADNRLAGKRILEFACGEGACGVILSRLGCRYDGVDIAPSAVEKATAACAAFPNARIRCLDMVKENAGDGYDAALDCMGLHMLVTDRDRQAYLGNAFRALKPGAPMLFFRQSYRKSAYDGTVETYKQWQDITGEDYVTPGVRTVKNGDRDIDVRIPLVPARSRTKAGYRAGIAGRGLSNSGFYRDGLEHRKSVFRQPVCPKALKIR